MKKTEKSIYVPEDLQYTESHEWIRMIDDITGICGITDYAQLNLGELAFVEFISNIIHTRVSMNENIVILESVKAAFDVHSPVTGRIVTVNRDAEDSPELINTDPYGDGWLFKIEISNRDELDELLSPEEYQELVAPHE